MAGTRRTTGVAPATARKTWRTLEPLHGMIYFAPEAQARYADLGLTPTMGYFASRAAAMGDVSAGTVTAAFYNFNPRLVHEAIPAAWSIATPAAVLAARLAAADDALVRLLTGAVGGLEMARAASLARAAAERACESPEGRCLFAAHAGLPWPERPHLVLWQAQTLLREFRGDGHVAALLTFGLSPLEALVVHAASGEVPAAMLAATRQWSDEEWAAGVRALSGRGWLDDGPSLALSPDGSAARREVEDLTDQLAVAPYGVLGEEGCDELRALCRPMSQAVVAAGAVVARRASD